MSFHPTLSETKRNVFISYCWENASHLQWVKGLADAINDAGGNSILDQDLTYGGNLRIFMDKMILGSDVVLMILTPGYKERAEILKGGVGYEYNIITKELFKVIHKNEKYIPIIRLGDHESSVPAFLDDYKYADLRDSENYDANLTGLINQILQIPLKHPEKKNKNLKPMEVHYERMPQLLGGMNNKAHQYFTELFSGDSRALVKAKIAMELEAWEEEISGYRDSFIAKFNPEKMALYKRFIGDFKENVFKKNLWTVRAAMQTPDPDLATYKAHFRDAKDPEIFKTVNDILTASHEYVKDVGSKLDYFAIESQEELQMSFLENEGMFMKQIIGFGIRSEILHRYHPQNFPIMTQQNLWAMYFICESANEFIKIEQKVRAGQMRVSHNWQYPYERFTFLMNELANQFHGWIAEYGLKWNEKYRFGYINLFLAHIHKTNLTDIKLLHEWA